jgi:hypothetical protein
MSPTTSFAPICKRVATLAQVDPIDDCATFAAFDHLLFLLFQEMEWRQSRSALFFSSIIADILHHC